eukprot:993792_1
MYSFASSFAFTATGLIVANRDNKTWIDHRQRNHWIHCSPLNASFCASKYSTTSTQNTYSVSSNTPYVYCRMLDQMKRQRSNNWCNTSNTSWNCSSSCFVVRLEYVTEPINHTMHETNKC